MMMDVDRRLWSRYGDLVVGGNKRKDTVDLRESGKEMRAYLSKGNFTLGNSH